MSQTPKKIYVASSNATSSSRLCKSVEDFSLVTVKFVWKSKSCVAPCRGRDLRQFPWEK